MRIPMLKLYKEHGVELLVAVFGTVAISFYFFLFFNGFALDASESGLVLLCLFIVAKGVSLLIRRLRHSGGKEESPDD